jgi:ubiquitin-like protein Pup
MEQQRQTQTERSDNEVVEEFPRPATGSTIDRKGLDDLLDEIDEVLEENAEEFVRNYVQKGGE